MKRQLVFILFMGLFVAYVFSSTFIVSGCGGGGGGGGGGFLPTPAAPAGTFDDGNLQGWSVTGLWHLTQNRSVSAPYSVWYADEATGNYDTGVANSGDLISPAITLSGTKLLRFDYFLENECAGWFCFPFDILSVHVSNDGGVIYTPIDQLGNRSGTSFSREFIDLSAYANQTVNIKFNFDTFDDLANTYEGAYVDNITVTDVIDPASVFDAVEVTYYYSNNLVNGIWHGPSNKIIVGHYLDQGYWSYPAGTGGYPVDPDNDTVTSYDRMVHMPATNTVIHTDSDQFPSAYDEIYVGTIDPATGAISGFAVAVFSDGFTGNCNLISSSASDFLCYDGTVIRHYATTTGSPILTYLGSVALSSALTDDCSANCYGGTFAWDGMYYYFASSGITQNGKDYRVYDESGTFVSTYTAAGTGGINGTYFDWSVGRYATHSGWGTRGGGTEYTWSGGTYDNDSQNYSPVSAVHGTY